MENNLVNMIRSIHTNTLPQNFIFAGFINSNDILEQSFNEEKNKLKPLSKDYKENHLKETILNKEELLSEISCSICQDIIREDEKIIKLECKEQTHYFHIGNDKERCEGIYPWFEENNTCPMCRKEVN